MVTSYYRVSQCICLGVAKRPLATDREKHVVDEYAVVGQSNGRGEVGTTLRACPLPHNSGHLCGLPLGHLGGERWPDVILGRMCELRWGDEGNPLGQRLGITFGII